MLQNNVLNYEGHSISKEINHANRIYRVLHWNSEERQDIVPLVNTRQKSSIKECPKIFRLVDTANNLIFLVSRVMQVVVGLWGCILLVFLTLTQ